MPILPRSSYKSIKKKKKPVRKRSVFYLNEPVYINPKSRGSAIVRRLNSSRLSVGKRLKKAQTQVRRQIRPKPLGIDYSNFKYNPFG